MLHAFNILLERIYIGKGFLNFSESLKPLPSHNFYKPDKNSKKKSLPFANSTETHLCICHFIRSCMVSMYRITRIPDTLRNK